MPGNLRERLKGGASPAGQGDLFAVRQDPRAQALLAELDALDINTLTPIQALAKLNELKRDFV